MYKYLLLFILSLSILTALVGQETYRVSVERSVPYTNLPSDAKQVLPDSNTFYLDLPFAAKAGKETIKKLVFSEELEFWGMAGVESEGQSDIQYIIPLNSYSAVYFSDLGDYEGAGLYYTTEGMEGERIFKMEWRNIPFFVKPESNVSFQAWLHEKDNSITYLIGETKNSVDSLVNVKTLIGVLNNANGGGFGSESFLLTGDPYTPSIETGISYDSEPVALSTIPENGTKYTIRYGSSNSTEELKHDLDVRIFPNPASDVISVRTAASTSILSVQIMDLNGKKLASTSERFDRIDVSNLVSGSYILHVQSDKGSQYEKIEIH